MKIRWLGHSCFNITASDGTSIICDPFDESVGYPVPAPEADIVTISHGHHDHNNSACVGGNPVIFSTPGDHSSHGICIRGVAVFHDHFEGKKRGNNIIYTFDVDGLKVCHCGDLGHVLDAGHIEKIGHVDVLMIPTGGFYTIDAAEALHVKEQLNPAVLIPMHYKTAFTDYPIDKVEAFLKLAENYTKVQTGQHPIAPAGGHRQTANSEVEITAANIREMPGIIVFENYS